MKDPYEIIGVSKTATAEEITKAYRKLAFKHHPDRNPGDQEAENKFKELSGAYEILNDANRRRHYDTYGSAPPASSPFRQGKPFTSVMDDFFSSLFGQKRHSNSNEHIHTEVHVTLEQACLGGDVEVKFERQIVCKTCKGVGGIESACKHCDGTGFKVIVGEAHTVRTNCHACNTSGKVVSEVCPDCNNGVASTEEATYVFKIPIGVENGMRFAHAGLGNPLPEDDKLRGNLYVTVHVVEHELFKRFPQGNIVIEVPVSYTQLVLGADIEVPTVSGKRINFKIPKGTQDGAKFRLAGVGMPVFNNGGNIYHSGDQLVQVRLEVPMHIDENYSKVIGQLAELEQLNVTPMRGKFLDKLG